MKFLKWAAIVGGGLFVLLIVIGMLIPDEFVEQAREERRQREAERSQAASAAPSTPTGTQRVEPSSADAAPSLTAAQRNAVRSANGYLRMSGFSRRGLIDQLSSDYGDKFSVADATAAVDSLNVDWNTQAARSAEAYLKMSGFSCRGLIDQLSSDYGDKYTTEQATYGARQAGIC